MKGSIKWAARRHLGGLIGWLGAALMLLSWSSVATASESPSPDMDIENGLLRASECVAGLSEIEPLDDEDSVPPGPE